mgnify:FL=1
MSKVFKLRLLKDLPEYSKDCVFVLEKDKEWRGYWDGGNWTLPDWLNQLLYCNIPEVNDEMYDWFKPIKDEESTVYQVYMNGDIKEKQIYNFWLNDSQYSAVFETREKAERIAEQLKSIFAKSKETK